MKNKEKKTYVVLGMHRSATSFIARLLSEAGVDMGSPEKLMGSNEWNENGHFENVQFQIVNNDILREAGGNWENPPSEEAVRISLAANQDRIKEIIEENEGPMWGWKDPRTCLTGEGYLPHLDGDVYLICCFRKPLKVAESLQRRNGFGMLEGEHLARQYNRRLLQLIRKFLDI